MIATELSSLSAVPIYQQQKIDLRESYPCPCCRGTLQQIVLTEALGCDRCQKIFALWKDGYIIEQTSSPYHNCWCWDGKHWQTKNPATLRSWILLGGLVLTAVVAIGGFNLLSRSPEKTPIAPRPARQVSECIRAKLSQVAPKAIAPYTPKISEKSLTS